MIKSEEWTLYIYKNFPTQEKTQWYKGAKDTLIEWAVKRLIVLIPANEGDINQ